MDKKRNFGMVTSKKAIILVLIILAIALIEIITELFANNVSHYISLSISVSMSVIKIYLFYELCIAIRKLTVTSSQNEIKETSSNTKEVVQNLSETKMYIINQYTEQMYNDGIHDDRVSSNILSDPTLLEYISRLRVSLYSMEQQISFSEEQDEKRFDRVLDSLRHFSQVNISELVDNLDYLSAYFGVIGQEALVIAINHEADKNDKSKPN